MPVWSLELADSRERMTAFVPALTTAIVGAGLMRFLQRRLAPSLLCCFRSCSYAELVLACSTRGSLELHGVFALAIVYVGLTQRPLFVPSLSRPQPRAGSSARANRRIDDDSSRSCGDDVVLVGLALASRTAVDRSRNSELFDRANTDALHRTLESIVPDRSHRVTPPPHHQTQVRRWSSSTSTPSKASTTCSATLRRRIVDRDRHRYEPRFRSDDISVASAAMILPVLMRHADLQQATEPPPVWSR